MTDAQMDSQVAGVQTIETRDRRNTVWTVFSLEPPLGENNGGYDATAYASKGLVKAVGVGALGLY
jgi:hypothetical protein